MINKLEKIYNVVTAILFSVYALIALIFVLFLPKYNILFSGWWTLIIIIPSLGSLLFQHNKGTSLYLLILGICILLTNLQILNFNKCFTILICLAIIFIGINIVKTTLKIPNKKDSNTKFVPFYYAFLGSTEEKVENKFSGGNTKVVFGYLSLDLKNTKIEKNSTLKVLSIFGETEIFLPDNVEVITSSSNILGGTENLRKADTSSKKTNKIYIETLSILGNTRIR